MARVQKAVVTKRFEDGLRERLLTPAYAALFLEAVLREGDKEEIANAIQLIAESQGMNVTVTAPETQKRIEEALTTLQGAYSLTAPSKPLRSRAVPQQQRSRVARSSK
jgi:DNA-binding phage protein